LRIDPFAVPNRSLQPSTPLNSSRFAAIVRARPGATGTPSAAKSIASRSTRASPSRDAPGSASAACQLDTAPATVFAASGPRGAMRACPR
jgi:hypothetical protein